MDQVTRQRVYKATGIIGLTALLGFTLWLDRREVKPNGGGSSPARHRPREKAGGTGGEHDHANPAQHGNDQRSLPLAGDDTRLAPSGTVAGGVRMVKVTAFMYGYAPNPVVVRAGENVELQLRSRDVKHGLMIPALDFNLSAGSGASARKRFRAPATPGKYPFFCSVFCGSSHGSMQGYLLVLPNDDEGHDNGH